MHINCIHEHVCGKYIHGIGTNLIFEKWSWMKHEWPGLVVHSLIQTLLFISGFELSKIWINFHGFFIPKLYWLHESLNFFSQVNKTWADQWLTYQYRASEIIQIRSCSVKKKADKPIKRFLTSNMAYNVELGRNLIFLNQKEKRSSAYAFFRNILLFSNINLQTSMIIIRHIR